jgi:hypothetical protein
LRITYHVDEWKKSCTPLKVDAITEGFFLVRTLQQTRARRKEQAETGRRGRQ